MHLQYGYVIMLLHSLLLYCIVSCIYVLSVLHVCTYYNYIDCMLTILIPCIFQLSGSFSRQCVLIKFTYLLTFTSSLSATDNNSAITGNKATVTAVCSRIHAI